MDNRFVFHKTQLNGLWVVERKVLMDKRGTFVRLFCADEFFTGKVKDKILQINYSITKLKSTVRGLHFQNSPYRETKIVTCLKGKVFDVAVDLRQNSNTFLHWHAEILSEDNNKSFIIPEGFAHGFQSLTDNCKLLYMHTAKYSSEAECGINIKDKKINIVWPLPVRYLSIKDKNLPFVEDNYKGIIL